MVGVYIRNLRRKVDDGRERKLLQDGAWRGLPADRAGSGQVALRAGSTRWICLMMLATLGAFGAFVYFSVSHWLSTSLDELTRLGATQLIATADVDDGKLQVDDDPVILDAGLTDELRSRAEHRDLRPLRCRAAILGPSPAAVEPAVLREALAGRSTCTPGLIRRAPARCGC